MTVKIIFVSKLVLFMFSKIFFYLSILFISTPAYAYLDPGLGSLILQSLIGGIAVAFGFISFYWKKFKSFFTKKPKDKKNK